ncbi:hypothetical protein ACWCPX_29630 [Streptomyces olivaceoviridis]
MPPLESWRRIDAWLATHAADRGYDHDTYRTISGLHGFRRPRIHCGRRDHIHEAFPGLATCLITHRHVQRLRRDLSGK